MEFLLQIDIGAVDCRPAVGLACLQTYHSKSAIASKIEIKNMAVNNSGNISVFHTGHKKYYKTKRKKIVNDI